MQRIVPISCGASSRASPRGSASAGLQAGRRLPGRASVASRPDDRAQGRQEEERQEDQADEQSLLHVLESQLQDGRSPYGFPYLRGRPTGESSTLPSVFSIFSTSTPMPSPRRYVPPPRRPTSAVPSSFSSK